MSRRPRSTSMAGVDLAQRRSVPGGRMWNEMPVTEVWNRVAAAGEEGAAAAPALCTGSGAEVIASGSGWAEFGPGVVGIAGAVGITYIATGSGTVWLQAITEDPSDPLAWVEPTPCDPLSITAGSAADVALPPGTHFGAGSLLSWRIEWSPAGLFSDLCSEILQFG